MTALKYLALWLIAFAGISMVDAFWHLVIWGKSYGAGIKKGGRLRGQVSRFQK